jgi:hypothetical protein
VVASIVVKVVINLLNVQNQEKDVHHRVPVVVVVVLNVALLVIVKTAIVQVK